METINDLVGYNNLKIFQNDDWFKFSLESILLPCFVNINNDAKLIMDLCTGNAPIPIVLSTMTDKKIVGVEIQKDIYELGVKSVNINNLEDQITLINDNLNNIMNYYDSDTFDIITCNPPYFKNINTSLKNNDPHKVIARHEVETNLEEIIKVSRKLLKNNGKLYLVHRVERFLEIIDKLKEANLMPKRCQFIYPKINSPANLVMIEATKNGKDSLIVEKPLIVHLENGNYTREVLDMFRRK